MLKRREFLQRSAGLAALAAASPWAALPPRRRPGRCLVVVELLGGNDGLSAVVPYDSAEYRAARGELAVERARDFPIGEGLGFHPELAPLHELFRRRLLTVVHGVGYPRPDRSHFRSQDIWHTADRDRVDRRSGWLGRVQARLAAAGETVPEAWFIGEGAAPLAFEGGPTPCAAVPSLARLRLEGDVSKRRRLIALTDANEAESDLAWVRRSMETALTNVTRLKRLDSTASATAGASSLRRQLDAVTKLIGSGVAPGIFWVRTGGYDTHAAQADVHPTLLRVLAHAIAEFRAGLERAGLAGSVTTLVFSEFGRRVRANGSGGTDHGAAGPVFIMGDRLRDGCVGRHPSLTDLDDGDLRHGIDFRHVYREILAAGVNWSAAVDAVRAPQSPAVRIFA